MAADQGYYAAQGRLGLAYKKGEGVELDLAQAVNWFRKASLQNCSTSMTNLAACYVSKCTNYELYFLVIAL
jgi:TPR repeat protein